MKNTSIWIPAAALALGHAFAAELPAQRYILDGAPPGWLGFFYVDARATQAGNEIPVAVVDRVVAGSPADRAGIEPGDTIIRLNGRAIGSREVILLRRRLEPGDTVRLRARRDGRELDIVVIAAERPVLVGATRRHPGLIVLDADSLRRTVRVYMDSIRTHLGSVRLSLDTLRLRHLYIDRDEPYALYLDRVRPDSVIVRRWGRPDSRGFPGWADADSFGFIFPTDALRAYSDSLAASFEAYRIPPPPRVPPDARWYGWEGRDPSFDPSRPGFEPPPAIFGFDFGRHAVAGAEFTELNPGLARYFDADDGLLVLRVAPGTPAARAGLEAGDVVVTAAGEPVHSVGELRWAIARPDRPGPVELEILRDSERRRLQLQRED